MNNGSTSEGIISATAIHRFRLTIYITKRVIPGASPIIADFEISPSSEWAVVFNVSSATVELESGNASEKHFQENIGLNLVGTFHYYSIPWALGGLFLLF